MTRRVLVIGIGSGQPGHLTGDAVAALNAVDVFVVARKDAAKADLVALRTELCAAVIGHDRYRVVEVDDPPRELPGAGYAAGVRAWHDERAHRYADTIRREVAEDGTVGFLVWGDPSLYDSTLRIVDTVAATGLDLDVRVVPGLSSVTLLAAAHRIVLNGIGGSVHVTTGRRLVETYAPGLGDVVVMLDSDLRCAELVAAYPELEIFWGAQLGLDDETLVAGRLVDVVPRIREARAAIRARRGWVFDTYLLRSP